MTVYEWLSLVAASEDAYLVEMDLQTRMLMYKGVPIVVAGLPAMLRATLPDDNPVSLEGLINFTGDPYTEIERLYAQFKRSVPRKGDRPDKGNFKAVSSDSLSYAELGENMPRQQARILLEGFILLAAAAGILTWKNPRHFFWMGSDPDLIIYRDWVVDWPIAEKHATENMEGTV